MQFLDAEQLSKQKKFSPDNDYAIVNFNSIV